MADDHLQRPSSTSSSSAVKEVVLNSGLSPEGLTFIEKLCDDDFKAVLFEEKLLTLFELGKEVGEFSVSITKVKRDGEDCFMVHALSHGSLDDIPCGTSVTAFVSRNLETLEQHLHEYMELPDHSLDRKTIVKKENDGFAVDVFVKQFGEDTVKTSRNFSHQEMKGAILEGCNFLLSRLLVKKGFPINELIFLSLDSELVICPTYYRLLSTNTETVGGKTIEVIGVERTTLTSQDLPMTWTNYYANDGHLIRRIQVGSSVTMVAISIQEVVENASGEETDRKPVFLKKPLNIDEDMEMKSKLLDRKEELIADHKSYMRENPEIQALLGDYLQFLLLRKPDDVLVASAGYFESFGGRRRKGNASYLNSQMPERHPAVKSNHAIQFLSKVSYGGDES